MPQAVRNRSFPQHGKLLGDFSTLWKIFFHTVEKTGRIFHSMEDIFENFPRYGKNIGDFSTVWKNFPRVSHSMENFSKRPGLRAFQTVFRGLLNGARGAPCEP
jgi:hypothetical protein